MDKVLMRGNEAIAEGALKAGCRYFFGYPITPQNEIPEYMAKNLPELGGEFLQAESELSAINMVYGASGAGARVMTSSSSPGISLKSEGISYIAAADLPCVIVNIVRAGPGLGGIQAAQSDYMQATKGMGHGDFKLIVYAPSTVQEAYDLAYKSFFVSDLYRVPVLILGDAVLGHIMEPMILKKECDEEIVEKNWATTGDTTSRKPNIINTLLLNTDDLEKKIIDRYERYKKIEKNEVLYEEYNCEKAEIIIVAYGTSSRIARNAIDEGENKGLNIGIIRPKTLWPFPKDILYKYSLNSRVKFFLTVEMSMGQMIEDVKMATQFNKPVYFYGRTGGNLPDSEGILKRICDIKNDLNYGGMASVSSI